MFRISTWTRHPVFNALILLIVAVTLGCSIDGGIVGNADSGGSSSRNDEDDSGLSFPEPSEDYVTEAFRDDFDGDSVDSSVWQVATWTEHTGQTSESRCYVENGYLTMVLVNPGSTPYLTSAIQTRDEYYYGRWEARLKPTQVSGVLNSFHTIDWDDTSSGVSTSDGTKQEIDIEFLTKSFTGSAGEVHFAVHEEEKPSFETNPDLHLPTDPSSEFQIWGVEITPAYIEWFVDDTILLRYEYDEHAVSITQPYQLKLNTRTQQHWIEGPPPVGVETVYLIDWIKFTPLLNE